MTKLFALVTLLLVAALTLVFATLQSRPANLESHSFISATTSTSPPTPVMSLECTNEVSGVSFGYPADWRAYHVTQTQIGLLPPGRNPDPSREYVGDILVECLSNPSAASLKKFYATTAEANLYEYARTTTPLTIEDAEAVRFSDVTGTMIPATIVAIGHDRTVIEVSDVGQQHQSDGVLDRVVHSVSWSR